MQNCNQGQPQARPMRPTRPSCETDSQMRPMRQSYGADNQMRPMRQSCGADNQMRNNCGADNQARPMRHNCGADHQTQHNCGADHQAQPARHDCEIDHMALAMAYVPWQHFHKTYEVDKALEYGTIFPELNKPFYGRRGVNRP